MTPLQIELVQASWRLVRPRQATAAELFYGRLFEIAPDTRALFRRDIHVQGAMLMKTLDTVVAGLADLSAVVPVAQDLARRHVPYGVRPAHYERVGTALLWTLEQALGSGFTPVLRAAWAEAYGTLAAVMIEAAWPAGTAAAAEAAPAAIARAVAPASRAREAA
jgi:nitric oxide dioxygenase